MRPLSAFLVLMALGGCAAEDKQEEKSYTYSYTENNCPTGTHTFSSLSDLCHALQDETKNQNCAQSLRRQRFEQDCPGTFNPF